MNTIRPRITTSKIRQIAFVAACSGGIPLSILTAQFAGAVLPLLPAAIIAAITCGTMGYLLILSIWKLIS